MKKLVLFCISGLVVLATSGKDLDSELPEAYWSLEQSKSILDQTAEITLASDLGHLKPQEREAVKDLLRAGLIMNDLYEISKHPQALEARNQLEKLDKKLGSPERTQTLLDLYYQNKGPIARTLDNRRLPFLPVDEPQKGGNLYPWGMNDDERSAFMQYLDTDKNKREELKHPRAVVKRATITNLTSDIAILDSSPLLDKLHPGLNKRLKNIQKNQTDEDYYALPYSVHFYEPILKAHDHLLSAARWIATDDPQFSTYLKQRAFDLLRDDYMAGDAAWVTGRYKNLNAQIGSYETYDDSLLGVKTYFSSNVLLKNREASEALESRISGLQAIHDALPYEFTRRINTNLPIGVYDVIADFGQARGANTATILPNEADQSERYGRTIMLRHNIMTHPVLFANTKAAFDAVVIPEQAKDLSVEGQFQRTLWHEIGHYLGVDKTKDGNDLDAALENVADLFEEMKADLVSLFSARKLNDQNKMDDLTYRSVLAGGIRRTLQKVRPKRSSPYGTMQLMQFNYFLENGALSFDADTELLRIDYNKFPQVAESMLADVLEIQAEGNAKKANKYVEKWGYWKPEIHDIIAKKMNDASQFRFVRVKYQALEDFMQELAQEK